MTNETISVYAKEMRKSGFNEQQIEGAVETLLEAWKECEYGLCAGDGEYPAADGPNDFVMKRCPCTYPDAYDSRQE